MKNIIFSSSSLYEDSFNIELQIGNTKKNKNTNGIFFLDKAKYK